MRHDVRQSVVMVSFHPDHFHIPFGIGKLANVTKKTPVFFGQTAKVKVGKNVSKKNQAAKTVLLKDVSGLMRPATIRTEVHIGEDQRVMDLEIHA
jgi:hypothetical protein